MAVYVDDMWKFPRGQYRGMKMSHMLADTDKELFAMADLLKLRREWFQGDHFDISLGKRDLAVKLGAVEISRREAAAIRWCKRVGRMYNSPAEAYQLMLDYTSKYREGGLNDQKKVTASGAIRTTSKR